MQRMGNNPNKRLDCIGAYGEETPKQKQREIDTILCDK